MTTSEASQNLKAGTFVLVGAALAITVIFVLSDAWGRMFGESVHAYSVRYPVEDGVSYLAEGSDVRIGGIVSGEVTSVQLDASGGPVDGIAVSFTLSADIELYSNAVIVVRSALIGSTSTLDVISVGWDAATRGADVQGTPGQQIADGGSLIGTTTGGLLGALVGPGAAQSTSAMLSDMAAITNKLRGDGEVLPWVVGHDAATSLQTGLTGMGSVMQRLEHDGELLQWAVGDSAHDDVTRTMASARTTMEALQAHWPLWSSAVGSTMANLDLTSQQMNLMVQELRNSPWRLLYRPTSDEASNELLYAASRNFVFGAADLRSAAASMDRLVADHGDAAEQQPAWALLKQQLEDAAKRYQAAEQQLNQVLQQRGGAPTE